MIDKEVSFGLPLWSAGLALNPMIQIIQSVQKHEKTQSLLMDECLKLS